MILFYFLDEDSLSHGPMWLEYSTVQRSFSVPTPVQRFLVKRGFLATNISFLICFSFNNKTIVIR